MPIKTAIKSAGLAHFLILALALSLPTTVSSARDCRHSKSTMKCVSYIGNYDGDTVTFNIPNVHPLIGEKITIRVAEIDTPELRSKNPCERQLALLAKERVATLLLESEDIRLHNIQRGKYFRILAQIHADEVSVGEVLIRENLAIPYFGGSRGSVDWCENLKKIGYL